MKFKEGGIDWRDIRNGAPEPVPVEAPVSNALAPAHLLSQAPPTSELHNSMQNAPIEQHPAAPSEMPALRNPVSDEPASAEAVLAQLRSADPLPVKVDAVNS